MFRIECFIDDKNLAKLKWALKEVGAYNVTDQPVADSKPNGKTRIPPDELPKVFLAWAKKLKMKEVRASQMREFCAELGLSEASYSHALGILKRANIITKHGKGSTSVVWKIQTRRAAK